jgi:hypothetical protein
MIEARYGHLNSSGLKSNERAFKYVGSEKEILSLQRSGITTASAELLLASGPNLTFESG